MSRDNVLVSSPEQVRKFSPEKHYKKGVLVMLSVVLPVVDKLKYTRDCLNSIKENSIIPNEIILIDNGREESSKCLVEEFRELNILYVRPESPECVNQSWNLGKIYSSKDLVLFLNNDTILNKFFIKKILYVMSNFPDIGICIPTRAITSPEVMRNTQDDDPILIPAKFIEGWAFTIRRSILDKTGPLPTDFKTFMGDTFLYEASITLGYKNMQITNSAAFHYGSLTVKTIHPDYITVQRAEDRIWRQRKKDLMDAIKKRNLID